MTILIFGKVFIITKGSSSVSSNGQGAVGVGHRLIVAREDAGYQRHAVPPASARTPTRRCGRAAEIPVNQLSNSMGDRVALSRNLGSNRSFELREAKPDSQVVAEI